jgi:hypothetical protein
MTHSINAVLLSWLLVMHSVTMLNVTMLSVKMLSVIMLSVMTLLSDIFNLAHSLTLAHNSLWFHSKVLT